MFMHLSVYLFFTHLLFFYLLCLGKGHSHILLQRPLNLYSFFESPPSTGVSAAPSDLSPRPPGAYAAESGEKPSCINLPENSKLSCAREKEPSSPKVSLHPKYKHPSLSFLHTQEPHPHLQHQQQEQQQQGDVIHPTVLQQAVRKTYYAYSLYEGPEFKLHIHRNPQKKLLANLSALGVFSTKGRETEDGEWDSMAGVARSYLGIFVEAKL